ncbi:hypothetical protein BH23GEM3_BH23GEM3_13080 [soil metagenome]
MRPVSVAERSSQPAGLLLLWLGIFGPPTLWAGRIAASYILIPYACRAEQVRLLHAVSAVALLAVSLIGFLAWRTWRKAAAATRQDPGAKVQRARFMALFGLFSSGLFAFVILAEWLTVFFVHPCLTAGGPVT